MRKSEIVKKYILEELSRYKPHQRIMSRQMLCRKFGFARTTVDTAIRQLLEEGVLYSVVGSGTYVAEGYHGDGEAARRGIVTWGVILPNMVQDVCPQLIRGIEDFSRVHDINVVICNTDHDIAKQNLYANRLLESGVSGVIMIPAIASERDVSVLRRLRDHGVPIVFCCRQEDMMPEVPLVCSNDFYGGYIATKHLLDQGYTRIAYVARRCYKTTYDRFFGYLAALTERDLPVDRRIVLLEVGGSQQEYDDASKAICGLLRPQNGMDPPDAFFCFDDVAAISVTRAVHDCGLSVSRDIGLIGYNDSELCDAFEVKLTSVRFYSYEIGRRAAEILYAKCYGLPEPDGGLSILQPDIAVRHSCVGKGREP